MLGPPSKTIALFILVAAIALPTALAPTVLAYDGSATPVIAQFTWPWKWPWEGWNWNPLEDIKKGLCEIGENFKNWIKQHILEPLGEAIGSTLSSIATAIGQFFSGVGKALYDLATAPINALKEAWGSLAGWTDTLPSWAKPLSPLIITGVVAAAGLMIYYVAKAVLPGI